MRSPDILYVTDGFAPYVIGGMQSVARRQIETLVAAGMEVVSVSSRGDGPVPNNDLIWRNIHLPWPEKTPWRARDPWRYVRELQAFSRQVGAVIDSCTPGCVYAEGPLLDDYLSRPRGRRVPTIFHPHGLEMFQDKGALRENLRGRPLHQIVRRHARHCDTTVCLSAMGKLHDILQSDLGLASDKIAVLRNAAPDRAARPLAPEMALPMKFLFVGRNEPRKALPAALTAFALRPETQLDIVGTDQLPPGTPSHIRAHGMIRDRERVATFFDRAHFLVVPSTAEGVPTVILEAFAAGVPVIATDVGGVADLVTTDKTGFLVPPADAMALDAAIDSACAMNDAAYASLSNAARDLATGRFSSEQVGLDVVALFRRILGDRSGFSGDN